MSDPFNGGESNQSLGALNSTKVEYQNPDFWNREKLQKELIRQFDICHSCRMCLSYCPSFPALFNFIDQRDGAVEELTREETGRVVDLCFNCKLCFVKCPYTPPHEFMIDIPKLVQRERAVRVKEHNLPLNEQIINNPELLGNISAPIAPLVNFANKNPVTRMVMEVVGGVDRRAILPLYHRETFMKWWEKRVAQKIEKKLSSPKETEEKEQPVAKVALFHTCLVNYQAPHIGKALVAVLEKNNIEVVVPAGQHCCGMPQLDAGDVNTAHKMMKANIRLFSAYANQGYDIVIPEPTCGMMLRKEYKDQLPGVETELVAVKSFDIMEYLFKLKRKGKLNTDFKKEPGKLVYHMPCHLKYQAMGRRSLDMLKAIPGTEVIFADKGCCGHSGSWGMRKEYYEEGMKVGTPLFNAIKEEKGARPVTDCLLAGIQIQQGIGLPAIHPIEVLAEAYGLKEK